MDLENNITKRIKKNTKKMNCVEDEETVHVFNFQNTISYRLVRLFYRDDKTGRRIHNLVERRCEWQES